MDKKQTSFISVSFFVIYFIVICYKTFAKPQGWSIWPASWQADWQPNYLLFIVLIIIGVVISYGFYHFFTKK